MGIWMSELAASCCVWSSKTFAKIGWKAEREGYHKELECTDEIR